MPKVTIVQVVYNNRRFIEPVFSAIYNQTFKDFKVVAVISGNADGSKELLKKKFPDVEIIDPGYNIGFAAGHNLAFEKYQSDFFQLVNPDLILEPNYIEEMLRVFAEPKVGAATGKLYQVERQDIIHNVGADLIRPTQDGKMRSSPTIIRAIDSTGVTIAKSGRARDRGQHETDNGQYDKLTDVIAVSGAGPMYRRAALSAVSCQLSAKAQFFDESFHSYWEDVDLTWRMSNAGWLCKFVPSAIGYHGRGAGSFEKGYADVLGFIRHHKKLPPRIKQLNYKNHIFMYIKNSPYFYPQFFVREFFMFCYILFFEISTFKILPQLIGQLPRIFKKRKFIKTSITRGRALC